MLISLAVDCHHADVSTRERFHLTAERAARLRAGRGGRGDAHGDAVSEVVSIATCNRSEVYAWCPGAGDEAARAGGAALARRWMGRASDAGQLLTVARRREGTEAARHLLRVAAGVESQVLGDAQILGQLREAYGNARDHGGAGTVLGRLFDAALRVGKRVRAETALLSGPTSVGAAAATHVARRIGTLPHARVLVVGCGKTGARAARQLVKLGVRDLVLVNRSRDRAEALAASVGGRVAPLAALHGEAALADVVIVATGATAPVLLSDPLVVARRNCATAQHPLLVVDLAMPRNVDPAVASVRNVVLVDLDALNPLLAASAESRRAAVPAADAIVAAELAEFATWLDAAVLRAAIHPLRDALRDVCLREVRHAAGDAVAERTADRIVAKLLARPMTELRHALARGERVDALAAALARLFAAPPPAALDGD